MYTYFQCIWKSFVVNTSFSLFSVYKKLMWWAISPCLILKTQQQEIMTILFILFKTNRWKWSFFSPHPLHSCNVVPLLDPPVGKNFGGEGEECGLFCFPRLPYLGTVSLQFCSSPIVASKETVSLCWSGVKDRKWGYQRRDKVNCQLSSETLLIRFDSRVCICLCLCHKCQQLEQMMLQNTFFVKHLTIKGNL